MDLEARMAELEKKLKQQEQLISKLENRLDTVFIHLSEINKSNTIEETIDVLSSLGEKELEAEECKFWFYEQNQNKAFTISNNGEKVYTDLTKDTAISRAILSNEAIMLTRPELEANFLPVADNSYISAKNVAVIPLTSDLGSVMGVIVAHRADSFTKNDIDMFSSDGKIGSAFKLGLTKEMQHQDSITDKLTRLKNRCGMDEYIKSSTLDRLLNKETVCTAMCDIDHFKLVNDTYGHDAGDKVLRHVAETLKEQIGEAGEVFRQGGEEFVVLFNKSLENTVLEAEKIREAIQNTPCDIGNGKSINISMSIGVIPIMAQENISKDTVKSAVNTSLSMADKLLYTAKENGRNQVIDFDRMLKIKGIEPVKDDPFAKDGFIILKHAETGKECGFDGIEMAITCLKDEQIFQERFEINKTEEKQIVGNTPYYQLGTKDSLQYINNLNNRHAANIMRELDKNGVKHSGVVIGDKTTITINKADMPKYYAAVDTVKQIYSTKSLEKWQDKAEEVIAQAEKNRANRDVDRGR
jgi:diguanylate cyclase (GGDEF)-like protein